MAEEETQTDAEPSGGGMMKKLILVGVGVVLLGVGAFAGLTFMKDDPAEGEEVAEAAPAKGPAIYQSLHPPLVVNFKDSAGQTHFMQATMEVMSRDQEVINAVRDHTPVIRNSLIMLFSNAVYEEITTREGKEKLLEEGLAEIQRVMLEEAETEGIEAVYFTALVIQ